MLELLHIENIAVIQEADIQFRPGFNALTGETGAGKSIVIDAMGAVLGGRTSRDLVRTGADRAFVSAEFSQVPGDLAGLAETGAAPDEDGHLLLQRELFPYMSDYVGRTHDMGLPRSLLTMLSLNAVRYENGTEERLLEAFHQLSGYAAFKDQLRGIDGQSLLALLRSSRFDGETGAVRFANSITAAVQRAMRGECSAEMQQAFQSLMGAVLVNESVYMPVNHYLLPLMWNHRALFSELWVDPDAEGVLPVCIGKATRVCDLLTDKDKVYEAVMLLGKETDTQDMTGTILKESEVNFSIEEVKQCIESFVGEYAQIPPMYSALKVNGKKLCDLAREGVEVERKARKVQILDIAILSIDLPRVTMRVHCSKGTYIRTLCHDIGEKLGCGACMEYLVRTRVSDFQIEDAKTLQEIETIMKSGKIEEILYPIDTVFKNLPQIHSRKDSTALLYNGNKLPLPVIAEAETIEHTLASFYKEDDCKKVRVYDNANHFVGIYEYRTADRLFKPVKLFFTQQ